MGKMRHARAKHVLKHQRAHSKVGNRQFGIASCLRCGKDVAAEKPLFLGKLRLCRGCQEQAEIWATAQSIIGNKPPARGTHNEKRGFNIQRTSKPNGHPNQCTCERCV